MKVYVNKINTNMLIKATYTAIIYVSWNKYAVTHICNYVRYDILQARG